MHVRKDVDACKCPADTSKLEMWTMRGKAKRVLKEHLGDIPFGAATRSFRTNSLADIILIPIVAGVELSVEATYAGIVASLASAINPKKKVMPPCVANLGNIEIVDAPLSGLTSIDPISSLPSIKEGNFQGNYITQMPRIPRSVEKLDLTSNKITSISGLDDATGLKRLVLDGNHIKKVDGLAGAKNLESLAIEQNKIKTIDTIASMKKLAYINASRNKIKWFDINALRNKLPSLDKLIVTKNPLKHSMKTMIKQHPEGMLGIDVQWEQGWTDRARDYIGRLF